MLLVSHPCIPASVILDLIPHTERCVSSAGARQRAVGRTWPQQSTAAPGPLASGPPSMSQPVSSCSCHPACHTRSMPRSHFWEGLETSVIVLADATSGEAALSHECKTGLLPFNLLNIKPTEPQKLLRGRRHWLQSCAQHKSSARAPRPPTGPPWDRRPGQRPGPGSSTMRAPSQGIRHTLHPMTGDTSAQALWHVLLFLSHTLPSRQMKTNKHLRKRKRHFLKYKVELST